jgi:hypothetical protein
MIGNHTTVGRSNPDAPPRFGTAAIDRRMHTT